MSFIQLKGCLQRQTELFKPQRLVYEARSPLLRNTATVQAFINTCFDWLASSATYFEKYSCTAFQVLGCLGIILVAIFVLILALGLHLSLKLVIGLAILLAITFISTSLIFKLFTGEERLVLYQVFIAVIAVTTLVLNLLQQPTLAYLDVMTLGFALFVAIGRIGCLIVGCCHGRPSCWGICYGENHAAEGFPSYLVGVRLIPIQAIESFWLFLLVAIGCWSILHESASGDVLSWFVIAYGIGRFCFEFWRGDPNRPYILGFSEAQWTSLLLMNAISAAEYSGILHLYVWHLGATVALVVMMIAIALQNQVRRNTTLQLLHPHHIQEVANAVTTLSTVIESPTASNETASNSIPVCSTSLGVQISANRIQQESDCLCHYAFSNSMTSLTKQGAKTLADLVQQLKHTSNATEFIEGQQGVYHLLVHPSRQS